MIVLARWGFGQSEARKRLADSRISCLPGMLTGKGAKGEASCWGKKDTGLPFSESMLAQSIADGIHAAGSRQMKGLWMEIWWASSGACSPSDL